MRACGVCVCVFAFAHHHAIVKTLLPAAACISCGWGAAAVVAVDGPCSCSSCDLV